MVENLSIDVVIGNRGLLKQISEALLAFATYLFSLGTRPFRLPSCSALLSFRNRSADGRSQPGKSVFENIVGGSALDELNCQVFTHGTGNENERHVRHFSQGDFQCRHTVEGR